MSPIIKTSKTKSPLKILKSKRQALHKISNPEEKCAEGAFQIQSPIYGVNFSQNISIPQVRVNKSETELDSTFETS